MSDSGLGYIPTSIVGPASWADLQFLFPPEGPKGLSRIKRHNDETEKLLGRLLRSYISISSVKGDEFMQFPFLVSVSETSEFINLSLNPFFEGIEDPSLFVKLLEISKQSSSKSKYSAAFCNLVLAKTSDVNSFQISVVNLHKFMRVKDSAKNNFSEFKRSVLKNAIKYTEKKLNISIEIRQIYNGNRVDKLEFSIVEKTLDMFQ